MIKAVYKAREDGDWDFVAAFAGETIWDVHPADTYAQEWELETGDEVIVKDFDDLTRLVDVLEFHNHRNALEN
jgi:hypothetical protein